MYCFNCLTKLAQSILPIMLIVFSFVSFDVHSMYGDQENLEMAKVSNIQVMQKSPDMGLDQAVNSKEPEEFTILFKSKTLIPVLAHIPQRDIDEEAIGWTQNLTALSVKGNLNNGLYLFFSSLKNPSRWHGDFYQVSYHGGGEHSAKVKTLNLSRRPDLKTELAKQYFQDDASICPEITSALLERNVLYLEGEERDLRCCGGCRDCFARCCIKIVRNPGEYAMKAVSGVGGVGVKIATGGLA